MYGTMGVGRGGGATARFAGRQAGLGRVPGVRDGDPVPKIDEARVAADGVVCVQTRVRRTAHRPSVD